MDDIKAVTAENISQLRSAAGMTQAELADILNYSDKAISKWERGESLPDVSVLKQISDIFGVTLDYLTASHCGDQSPLRPQYKWMSRNHLIITALSVLCVWFIATVVFVSGFAFGENLWLSFVVSVPASLIVILVFNSLWGKIHLNLYIISGLIWTTLAVLYLLLLQYNYWLIFCTGIPLQLAAILSFRFRKAK